MAEKNAIELFEHYGELKADERLKCMPLSQQAAKEGYERGCNFALYLYLWL